MKELSSGDYVSAQCCKLGGIQVAGELQAPHFVGCSELSPYCFQAPLYAAFTKKGIFKISVDIAMTAYRLCGNSLLGKVSHAVIFCNDTCISSPRLLWA